jgi:dihydrofolate reductase
MRKLAVSVFSTLDGVMQAPGGPEEDPTGGFTHGGWSVNYWDEMMGQVMDAAMANPFDLLLGRKTYEIFAAHWPFAGDEDPAARRLNEATKYVVSNTLRTLTWRNSRLVAGNAADEVARLKSQDGPELQVHGSSQLIQALLAAGLIDELRLWTFPLVLGHGKRLFGKGAVPAAFSVADARSSTTGVLITTYRRAGAVRTGSFALRDPTEAELARRAKMAREG